MAGGCAKAVAKAKSWNGLKEGAPVDKAIISAWNKKMHMHAKSKSTPWCEIFVSSCFIQTSCIKGAYYKGAGCTQALNFYKKHKRFKKRGVKPSVGWQVMYNFKDKSTSKSTHTGLVISVSGKYMTVQEGNKNNKCARRRIAWSSSSIVGFGLPKYK